MVFTNTSILQANHEKINGVAIVDEVRLTEPLRLTASERLTLGPPHAERGKGIRIPAIVSHANAPV